MLLDVGSHNDAYSATKAEGEALVIKPNGSIGLLTCCIHPSSIFCPGDKLLVPSLVSAARVGISKFLIGNGKNMYDFTYVENVAHAHICAERALASEATVAERTAGEAYFVTNMEPIKFLEFGSLVLEKVLAMKD
ncbi:3beta-hydroxysteroid-dehydrogenase/decarboxylase isoform 1 [Camellia lanceoleosa]|uniref:3beta-hydroxysteroid-dehydrogenase/decarboxylase isoform 1 n=1 Tax=Camellia lanceoleosa TaxID=1840588 RepID=A0ACC0H8N9_9ERIC|nr:3beta-hydroxysteroid-dehydrogenase/decarboxylase isoform 1 [Camellia lanceoleosa]